MGVKGQSQGIKALPSSTKMMWSRVLPLLPSTGLTGQEEGGTNEEMRLDISTAPCVKSVWKLLLRGTGGSARALWDDLGGWVGGVWEGGSIYVCVYVCIHMADAPLVQQKPR